MNPTLTASPLTSPTLAPRLPAARWSLAALFFSNGAVFANWAARVPAVQAKLGLDNGVLGLALLGAAVGAIVAMPSAGWLVARHGSRRLSRVLALANCATLPLLALAPNLPLLILALVVFGAGHGGMDVAINAQAVAVEKHFGRPIMSSFHALWSTGGLVGAACGGLLASRGTGLAAHFTGAALALGTLVLIVSPHLWPAANENDSAPGTDLGKEDVATPLGVAGNNSRRVLFGLGLITFCVLLGEGAMADWSAVFLSRSLGAGEGMAAAGYAAFSLAMAAGRFAGDGMIARLGPVATARGGGALAVAGLALALGIAQPWAVLTGFAAVGLGFAAIVPIAFSAAGCLPGVSPGAGISAVSTVGYLGFLVGPPLIGLVAQVSSLRAALWVVAVLSAMVAALAPSVRPAAGQPRAGRNAEVLLD